MRIRRQLSVLGVAATVFSSALATTAPAMAAQSPPPPYHLSGSYVLGRTLATCLRYAQGCSTAPFPVQVTGNGQNWQIMNTSGLWDHPLSLAFGSGAWRAAGLEPESNCDDAKVSNTMVTIVLKMSGESIKGVAQQLTGILESDQGPTACNSSDHYRMKDGGLWGNAVQWQAAAKSTGIASSSTPVLGSVAWWPNSSVHEGGHVAYVEKVNSPTSIVISEMNYDNENGFRLVTITKSGGDWPGAFLHIADR